MKSELEMEFMNKVHIRVYGIHPRAHIDYATFRGIDRSSQAGFSLFRAQDVSCDSHWSIWFQQQPVGERDGTPRDRHHDDASSFHRERIRRLIILVFSFQDFFSSQMLYLFFPCICMYFFVSACIFASDVVLKNI